MENYNEIKKNIIITFLNPLYRYSSVTKKENIVNNMIDKTWFPITYCNDTETLVFHLGNNINISIKVIWKIVPNNNINYYVPLEFN